MIISRLVLKKLMKFFRDLNRAIDPTDADIAIECKQRVSQYSKMSLGTLLDLKKIYESPTPDHFALDVGVGMDEIPGFELLAINEREISYIEEALKRFHGKG